MLTAFGPGIWLADGPELSVAGFAYPTRMAVLQVRPGTLLIWSPVKRTPALEAAVLALGEVRWIVAPNAFHHTFLAEWQAVLPSATVLGAPGLRDKRRDIGFGPDLGETPVADWTGAVDTATFRGNRLTTEVVLFHRPSATALFCDLLQQFPLGWFRGWRALVARADLMVGPVPQVPRKFRLAFRDKAEARRALAVVQGWPVERVVMAHGRPVDTGGGEVVRQAFAWLGQPQQPSVRPGAGG
jgi:hypothetical protein